MSYAAALPRCYHKLYDGLRLCNNFTMNSQTVSCAATTHAVNEACDSLRLCDRQDHDFCDSRKLFEQPYLE